MVHFDDKVVGKNVVIHVKSVPAFYFPYFIYPIKEDQRATGFLFPHFGNSSVRGFDIGTGFFWAMGRSVDQTFYADHYSNVGFGFGHELRWSLPSPSRGDFRTYIFSSQGTGGPDYDLNWNAIQILPTKGRLTLLARRYSSTLFQNRYQDNFNLATSRTESTQLSFQQPLRLANFQAVVEDNRVFFSDKTNINRRLPSLRLNRQPQKIGKTGIVFGFEARGERLGRGNEERVDLYSRFDFAPQVSRPFTTTWLQVNPVMKYRSTYYGNALDPEQQNLPLGPSLTRRFLEGSVELDGPTFSRVFDNPGGFYSNRFKHVIGPEVIWTYRTAVDDFDRIPKFDGTDQFLGTHQVYYSLVQRLLAKRPDANGRSVPFEFFSWRLGQTYYVKIADKQNEFDPNYSTSFFGPGGIPDHNSPVSSRMRLRPTRTTAGNFDVEYDVNFKQLRNMSVGSTLGGERGNLTVSWNKALKVAELPEDRTTIRNFVRGLLAFEILPKRLTLEGSVNYDYVQRRMLQSLQRLRWDVQCCGFQLETIQFNYNGRDERQWRFNVELANMGSIGNFLGDQQGGPGKGPSGVGGLR
jgi:lipopolysaccharide assembly outer membrane protein LptD (OstA)